MLTQSRLWRTCLIAVALLFYFSLPVSLAPAYAQQPATENAAETRGSENKEPVDDPTDEKQTEAKPTNSPKGEGNENSQDENPKKAKLPPPLDVYMGRRIAQTMHYAGAQWLIRDEREREERCSLMLANLGLRRGMTVCDMGCGNGYHTIPMAQLIGEKGQAIGVDVQPEMLELLRERVEAKGVENVIPILGSYHNPRLPAESIDLILLVDVYHEFSYPERMLAGMRKALKPDGLIVLVEYRAEDKKVPIKRLHKMTKAQVNLEMEANGFVLAKEFDKLPWQHMMFFGKTKDDAKGKGSAKPKVESDAANDSYDN